ncbi:hypothetical protein E3N88_38292 [Mikania micrantha]|uniref:MULE transposase domain-containing protein n=1 Tax=Mikania micrantha TaxID=192012 RepID=A0A5N6LUD2_9ASTR|nr:hypothetical protein E3N88_38292 [Mikania micrantha]
MGDQPFKFCPNNLKINVACVALNVVIWVWVSADINEVCKVDLGLYLDSVAFALPLVTGGRHLPPPLPSPAPLLCQPFLQVNLVNDDGDSSTCFVFSARYLRFLRNALPMDDKLRNIGFQMPYQFHFCIRSQQDSLLHLFCQGEIASKSDGPCFTNSWEGNTFSNRHVLTIFYSLDEMSRFKRRWIGSSIKRWTLKQSLSLWDAKCRPRQMRFEEGDVEKIVASRYGLSVVAYAIVDEETVESWSWFSQQFWLHIAMQQGKKLYVIFDRHKGLATEYQQQSQRFTRSVFHQRGIHLRVLLMSYTPRLRIELNMIVNSFHYLTKPIGWIRSHIGRLNQIYQSLPQHVIEDNQEESTTRWMYAGTPMNVWNL